MGHDKQSPPASPSHNPPSLPEQSLPEPHQPNHSAIKLDYDRALTAFLLGDHNKAITLIKETSLRHQESAALAHRCQATICVKLAEVMDHQTAKSHYLKSAIDSAKRAASLSPNSLEFARFYANLLYQAGQEGKDYEEVVQECERALAIENPIDPAEQSFQEEQKIPTAQGRISSIQQELKSLIQKANIASISSWMRNFATANGGNLRLIPIRGPPAPEDPKETSFVQTKWPDEIKKATETPDDWSLREIQVTAEAASFLKQKGQFQDENEFAEFLSDKQIVYLD